MPARGRWSRQKAGRHQEAPGRAAQVGVEPVALVLPTQFGQTGTEPIVPHADEVGVEPARRKVADRRQLAVPPDRMVVGRRQTCLHS